MENFSGEENKVRYDFIRKDAFLTRCAFIKHINKKAALEKVKDQIEKTEKNIDVSKFVCKNMISLGLDRLKLKILEYGIIKEQAHLQWLKEFFDELEKYDKFETN